MESLKCFSGVVFSAQVDWSNFASGNVWLCGKFLEYCASGGTRVGVIWNVKRDHEKEVFKVSKNILPYEKWVKYFGQLSTPMFGSDFPTFCVFWGRPCHQKEDTPFTHFTQSELQGLLPPKSSSQAIGLANISKCDYFESPVPITGPTPRWLRRAGVP